MQPGADGAVVRADLRAYAVNAKAVLQMHLSERENVKPWSFRCRTWLRDLHFEAAEALARKRIRRAAGVHFGIVGIFEFGAVFGWRIGFRSTHRCHTALLDISTSKSSLNDGQNAFFVASGLLL